MKHTIGIDKDMFGSPDKEGALMLVSAECISSHEIEAEESDDKCLLPAVRIENEKIVFKVYLLSDGSIKIHHIQGNCGLRIDEESGDVYFDTNIEEEDAVESEIVSDSIE